MPIPYPKGSRRPNRPRSGSIASSTSSISYPPSVTSTDEEEESAMIQEEWEESLRQMEMVLSIVILPFFGKWYGRRFAYWAYDRYSMLGWTKAFFGVR